MVWAISFLIVALSPVQIIAQDASWQNVAGPITPEPENGVPNEGLVCEGTTPSLSIVLPFNFDQINSLLAICARQEYGGFAGLNAGAHCQTQFQPASILFDTKLEIENGFEYHGMRRRMLCFAKCRCASNTLNLPSSIELENSVLRTAVINVWSFKLKSVIPTTQHNPVHIPLRMYDVPFALDITSSTYPSLNVLNREGRPVIRHFFTGVWEDMITCKGPIPANMMPQSSSYAPMATLKLYDICRAEVLGGLHGINLGGYCMQAKVEYGPTVFFDDEHSGPGIHWQDETTLHKRLYCYAHCWCKVSPRPWPRPVVPWFHDAVLKDSNRGLVLEYKTEPNGRLKHHTITAPIGPREGSGDSESVTGEFRGGGSESLDDQPGSVGFKIVEPGSNVDKLPPLSFDPGRDTADEIFSDSARHRPSPFNTCSGSCDNMVTGCQSSGGKHDCVCMALPTERSALQRFVGACMSAAIIAGSRGRSRLPRDESSHTGDRRLIETGCVCNASYVSQACCDISKGGLIHEAAYLKLGELHYEDLKS